eukprot:CAMPEP_0175249516 /NCGR_PEP_ID=MMETSP0093-20121207/34684_1 /TAXON_ID=311494 /ORGANISM="Alexandrium monilatum, Strain CCMP3105" /LENGTH=47 /DNA_ID= /DNA_START= /DNA_END= /DNA_ORIENTATION=
MPSLFALAFSFSSSGASSSAEEELSELLDEDAAPLAVRFRFSSPSSS